MLLQIGPLLRLGSKCYYGWDFYYAWVQMLLQMGLLLRLGPNVITDGTLLHLGPVITLVPSTMCFVHISFTRTLHFSNLGLC